jgi:hypothetical protein
MWKETVSNGLHAGKNSRMVNSGRPLPSGMYMLRMVVTYKNDTRRMQFDKKLPALL